MAYTTSDFLQDVRLRGNIPDSSNDNNINSDANILKIATALFHSKLYPHIQSVLGDYYVNHEDKAITASQGEYTIPERAAGLILRDLQVVKGTSVQSLGRIESDNVTTTSTGEPQAYYLRHNKIVLYPTPNSTVNTLRIRYYMRPSRLIGTADCAQISSIDTGTNTVVVSSIPTTWSTATDLDFVSKSVPYVAFSLDQNPTLVVGTSITFAALPTGLVVGDWLSPAEYSPIPQLPFELIPTLAQMTVVKVLETMGDRDGNNLAWKDLQDDLTNALKLITNRNHGEPQKIVNRYFGRGRRF